MAASSSCSRFKSTGEFAQPIRFVCLNIPSEYKFGSLKIVDTFASYYGEKLPKTVYLRVPTGATWFGTYVHVTQRIEGLENFMNYYDVKPFHVFVLQYDGTGLFFVELFNCYAVEIDYGCRKIPLTLGKIDSNHVGSSLPDLSEITEFEIDKLCSTLKYNGKSTWSAAYEFMIFNKHLKEAEFTEVFTSEACLELGLTRRMNWIDLGFQSNIFHIGLKWADGRVFFNHEWLTFAASSRLSEGDICLLMTTSHEQKFEVVVFDNLITGKFNRAGPEQGKGLLKFFKFMNFETVISGELEVPRVFVDNFGTLLNEDIHIYLANGSEHKAHFCEHSNLMIGLKKMLDMFSVEENYVMFFEFLDRSTFYVSIYNTLGMDIFNHLEKKCLLSDVLKKLQEDVIVLSDCQMDTDEDNAEVVSVANRMESPVGVLNYFTISLTPSNVDESGHGAYFARHLLPLYRKWKNSTIVTLLCDGKEWKVGVHRKRKICRFGKGWDKFAKDCKLKHGQKLKFTLVCDYTLEVTNADVA